LIELMINLIINLVFNSPPHGGFFIVQSFPSRYAAKQKGPEIRAFFLETSSYVQA